MMYLNNTCVYARIMATHDADYCIRLVDNRLKPKAKKPANKAAWQLWLRRLVIKGVNKVSSLISRVATEDGLTLYLQVLRLLPKDYEIGPRHNWTFAHEVYIGLHRHRSIMSDTADGTGVDWVVRGFKKMAETGPGAEAGGSARGQNGQEADTKVEGKEEKKGKGAAP
jgi:hypothetical protein